MSNQHLEIYLKRKTLKKNQDFNLRIKQFFNKKSKPKLSKFTFQNHDTILNRKFKNISNQIYEFNKGPMVTTINTRCFVTVQTNKSNNITKSTEQERKENMRVSQQQKKFIKKRINTNNKTQKKT